MLIKMVEKPFKLLVLLFFLFICIFYFVEAVGLLDNNQWGWNLTGISYNSIGIGDFDNDNKTDILSTGRTATTAYTKLYLNNGTSLEENRAWGWNLTGVYDSSVALGDMDNDGDLDLVVLNGKVYVNNGTSLEENRAWGWNLTSGTGSTVKLSDINNDGRLDLISGNPKFRVYLNNGTSFNEDIGWGQNVQTELSTGTGDGRTSCIDTGDYDNDGDLDLVVAGHDGGDPRNKLFKNNGTAFVLDATKNGINSCDVSFGDIDNDGDLDLIELGAFFAAAEADVFINDNGTLTYNSTWTSGLTATKEGALALGDYNNDGKLDVLWTGNGIAKVYNNTGLGFSEDITFNSNLTGVTDSAAGWADLDNDNDLDAIILGSYLSKIYISNASLYRNNSLPYSPSTFQNYSLANGNVFLGWNNGSDNETISLGLYYTLRVGTTSGGNQIVSGAFGNGGRGGDGGGQNGQFGNMMQRRNISLSGSRFSVGATYYWNVQTIDTGLAKSAWSAEQTFTLTSDFTPPVVTLNAPSEGLVTNQTQNIVFNATVYDDYNLTNVSLYGNWTGTWHLNTTNSSGINNTNYIFRANATEGNWLWGIRACDATSNCRGSNSTFRIDSTYPAVVLVSPANGTSQTSSNAVTFTYNVSDIAINNCTLYLNSAANETDISITVNTSQTFAENVPNGGYNWSVRCADAANNINMSGNHSLTISYTPSETPASTSSGGGGGGGGSIAAVLTKVSRIIAAIAEGNNLIEFAESEKASVGIEEILLDSAAAASNVKITIEKLTAMPASISTSPTGDIYTYLQFNKTVLKDEDVKQAKITFSVGKGWVTRNGYDYNKIVLQRYATQWNALQTAYLKQNASNYYYEAVTPGFSVFAITAEKKAGAEKIEQAVNESEQEAHEISEGPPARENQQQEHRILGKRGVLFAFAAFGITAVIAVIMMAMKRNKRAAKK